MPPARAISTLPSLKRARSDSTAAARSGGVPFSERVPLPRSCTSGSMAPACTIAVRITELRDASKASASAALS